MRTLVVGCDASGKSTTLQRLHESFGDPIIESTSTPESRKFKLDNLSTLVDEEFIAKREQLYLNLTRQTLKKIAAENTASFIGTDATLVTRLSHGVMRECIGMDGVDYDDIFDAWIKDEQDTKVELPGAIVLTHAPFHLISDRIISRQKQGMKEEKFWGFNSQFFINNYQEQWKIMTARLSRAGFACIQYDTSCMSWDEFYDEYKDARDRRESAA